MDTLLGCARIESALTAMSTLLPSSLVFLFCFGPLLFTRHRCQCWLGYGFYSVPDVRRTKCRVLQGLLHKDEADWTNPFVQCVAWETGPANEAISTSTAAAAASSTSHAEQNSSRLVSFLLWVLINMFKTLKTLKSACWRWSSSSTDTRFKIFSYYPERWSSLSVIPLISIPIYKQI